MHVEVAEEQLKRLDVQNQTLYVPERENMSSSSGIPNVIKGNNSPCVPALDLGQVKQISSF
jgi:hypothetical protein